MTKLTRQWLKKADEDRDTARQLCSLTPTHTDQICFLCQQAVEKYVKALMQHLGLTIPKTHDIPRLISLLLPHDATLSPHRRGTKTFSRYAVDYRYPGLDTTPRQARLAMKKAELFREVVCKRLGLKTPKTKRNP